MPRLSTMPGLVGLILVVAMGSWWLASVALGVGSGLTMSRVSPHRLRSSW